MEGGTYSLKLSSPKLIWCGVVLKTFEQKDHKGVCRIAMAKQCLKNICKLLFCENIECWFSYSELVLVLFCVNTNLVKFIKRKNAFIC